MRNRFCGVKVEGKRWMALLLAFVLMLSVAVSIAEGEPGNESTQSSQSASGATVSTFAEIGLSREVWEKFQSGKLEYYDYYTGGTAYPDETKGATSYGSNGYALDPSYYVPGIDGETSVWVGGNGRSTTDSKTKFTDNDPNDIMSVLPYGTIYIDVDAMGEFKESYYYTGGYDGYTFKPGTIIEINKDHLTDFTLITSYGVEQGVEYKSSDGKDLNVQKDWFYRTGTGSTGTDRVSEESPTNHTQVISYIGSLDKITVNGEERYGKTIKAADGKPLITVTYPDVATLNDGTKADLVIEYTEVTVEATKNIGDSLRQTFNMILAKDDESTTTVYGPLGLMDANQFFIHPGLIYNDGEGNKNRAIGVFGTNNSNAGAIGADIEYRVSIKKDGEPVEGSIFWTSTDLDVNDRLNGKNNSDYATRPNTYAESITVVDGALSYAVVPYYDHTGLKNPLGIERISTTDDDSDTTKANGVRFYANGRLDGGTYDSGFAVLIDSTGTTMRWSGAKNNRTMMTTSIFDPTASHYVTHSVTTNEQPDTNDPTFQAGNGGTIYLEMYDPYESDIEKARKKNPGLVTVGVGGNTNHVVEANTKEGYYCNYVTIDGTRIYLTGPDAEDGAKELEKTGGVYIYHKGDKTVIFTRQTDGSITFSIYDYHENHAVHANFVRDIRLTVDKTVTGNMGNKTQDFEFTLSLYGDDLKEYYHTEARIEFKYEDVIADQDNHYYSPEDLQEVVWTKTEGDTALEYTYRMTMEYKDANAESGITGDMINQVKWYYKKAIYEYDGTTWSKTEDGVTVATGLTPEYIPESATGVVFTGWVQTTTDGDGNKTHVSVNAPDDEATAELHQRISISPGTDDQGNPIGTYNFTLSHGQNIAFIDLPEGIQYSVSERKIDGYDTSAIIKEDGDEADAIDNAASEENRDSEYFTGAQVLNKATDVKYTNSREVPPPTGIFDSRGPALAGFGLALLLMALLLLHTKKPE